MTDAAPETREATAEAVDVNVVTDTAQESQSEQTEEAPAPVTPEAPFAPPASNNKASSGVFVYDPNRIALRFVFANRDGLSVTVQCFPTDTVGEVKALLLSMWPNELPNCSGGDHLRLICMGKGILMPNTRTLKDCEVPQFKTHPTPVNVSVRPENVPVQATKDSPPGGSAVGSGASNNNRGSLTTPSDVPTDSCCVVL